ncbi:MAG: hypothetical protein ABL983_02790 [Nitrospira sp.]
MIAAKRMEIHYEVCTEDTEGFDSLGFSFATLEEADAELRKCLPKYPGAFVVRLTMVRVCTRQPQRLRAI